VSAIPKSLLDRFSFLEESDYKVITERLFSFIGVLLLKGDAKAGHVIQFIEENICIVDTTAYPEFSDSELSGNHALFLDLRYEGEEKSEARKAIESSDINYSAVFAGAGYKSSILVSNHQSLEGIRIESVIEENGTVNRNLKGVLNFIAKVAIGGAIAIAVIAATGGLAMAFGAAALSASAAIGITTAIAAEGMTIEEFTAQALAIGVTVAAIIAAPALLPAGATFFGSPIIASIVYAGSVAYVTNALTKGTSKEWFPGVDSAIEKTEQIATDIADAAVNLVGAAASTVSLTSTLVKNFPIIVLGVAGYILYSDE
jgi:hypothetical protein